MPTGPVKGGAVSALVAGYEMFAEGTAGVVILDATSCGEYIYDVEV
jgi:hypothetical protein